MLNTQPECCISGVCQHAAGEGKFSAFHGPVLFALRATRGWFDRRSTSSLCYAPTSCLPASASDLSDAGAISTRCRRSVAVHANSICALDWLSASVFGPVKPPASLLLRFFPASLLGWLLDMLFVNSFVASFSARCVRSCCGPRRCRMAHETGDGARARSRSEQMEIPTIAI
jgi:hypothetical protein